MHMDPLLPQLVFVLTLLLTIAVVLRALQQPAPVVYLITGLALGGEGLDVLPDGEVMLRAGEFGVLLLLFFLGTEISLPNLAHNWKVPILGTALQVGGSVAAAFAVGSLYGWSTARSVLLGFVIALSSTAVVLNLLKERREDGSPVGQDVISILLAQDLALAPMLIVVGLLGGEPPSASILGMQVVAAGLMLATVVWSVQRGGWNVPLISQVNQDPELRIFAALLLALIVALLSGLAHLSTAFGAFVGGLLLGSTKEVEWVHHSLDPLRVLLVALFLMAVGSSLSVSFVLAHPGEVLGLAVVALVLNTAVNAVALRMLGRSWPHSLFGGALLAQIGEFSFVLAAVGHEMGVITETGHQLALSVIATTLLAGAAWVGLVRRWVPTPAV